MSFRLELEPEDLRAAEGVASFRRWGMVLLVVLMVMAGSAAGLWAAWHVIGHRGGSGTIPMLHADERPVKVPPVNPGGMEVPDQDMYILNRDKPVDSRVEQLLPPPETPLPRPAPPQPVVTESPPPASPAVPAPAIAAPAATAPAPATVAVAPSPPPAVVPPASTPAVPPATAPAAPPAVAVAPPPPPAAAPPVSAAPPKQLHVAASGTGYRLQLGAVRSAEAAQQEWDRLKRSQADLLGGLAAEAHRIDLGERGVFYRIVAGPIADGGAAAHACDELKRRKIGCLLVKP
jgi:hypothetical protein